MIYLIFKVTFNQNKEGTVPVSYTHLLWLLIYWSNTCCSSFLKYEISTAVLKLSLIHIYKDTGKKIYTTEVYANRIEFAGAKMVDRPPFPEDAEGFLEIPEGMEERMHIRCWMVLNSLAYGQIIKKLLLNRKLEL